MENLRQLAQQSAANRPLPDADQPQKLEAALQRVQRRRRSAYEDYQDALISKEDYLRCRADYDAQERALHVQLDKLRDSAPDDPLALPWVKELLASGQLAGWIAPPWPPPSGKFASMRETGLRSTTCSRRTTARCWRDDDPVSCSKAPEAEKSAAVQLLNGCAAAVD